MAAIETNMADTKSQADPAGNYEIIIAPSSGWLRVNWKEMWEYRDLLFILIRRDFLAKYKQTVLGPIWFVLQPLLTALVMSIAFNRVAGIGTGTIPSMLFNLCALLPWSYFSQNITTGAATFTANSHLFGKVYFPRLVVPLAAAVSNLFALGLQLLVFLGFFAYYALTGSGVHMGVSALWAIPFFIITGFFSLGISLLMAASTAKYRDLAHLTPVLLQLWMFASPVFYPMTKISENPSFTWLAWANPMAPLVEATRNVLLEGGKWSTTDMPAMLGVSTLAALLALVLGVVAFNRAERTVVDSV
jgi:lipopolysaccharide transport system permease protein